MEGMMNPSQKVVVKSDERFDSDVDIQEIEKKLMYLYSNIYGAVKDLKKKTNTKLSEDEMESLLSKQVMLLNDLRCEVSSIEGKILELGFNLRDERKAIEEQTKRLGEEAVRVHKIDVRSI